MRKKEQILDDLLERHDEFHFLLLELLADIRGELTPIRRFFSSMQRVEEEENKQDEAS